MKAIVNQRFMNTKKSLTIAKMIREMPYWNEKSYFAVLEPSIGFEKS